MRRTNRRRKFTDKTLQSLSAHPPEHRTDWFDTTKAAPPGFGVRISPTGSVSFFRLYRKGARLVRWTIGPYPDLGLYEARRQAVEGFHDGDPVEKKKADRDRGTFAELVAEFFEAEQKKLKPRTFREWNRMANRTILPRFGNEDPTSITKADIKAYLRDRAKEVVVPGKRKEGGPIAANRDLELIRRVFRWAVEDDRMTENPAAGILKPSDENSRERVLKTEEIRAVLASVEGRPNHEAPTWLQFLTATRRGEIEGARWGQFDFEKRTWTLEDTKADRSHVLPLSSKAIDVLMSIKPENPGKTDRVFKTWRGDTAMDYIRRNTGITDIRNHDLRRTAATELAGLQVRPDVISRILNHAPGGPQASRIYNRYSYLPEIAAALELWARHLERIAAGAKDSNVVAFQR